MTPTLPFGLPEPTEYGFETYYDVLSKLIYHHEQEHRLGVDRPTYFAQVAVMAFVVAEVVDSLQTENNHTYRVWIDARTRWVPRKMREAALLKGEALGLYKLQFHAPSGEHVYVKPAKQPEVQPKQN